MSIGMFVSSERGLVACPKLREEARGSQSLEPGSYKEPNVESLQHAYIIEL